MMDAPTASLHDLDVDAFSGVLRTARKPWRCTCANRLWRVEVKLLYLYKDGLAWSTHRLDPSTTLAEAEEYGRSRLGDVACVGTGGVPSGWYESFEVVEVANPNYREDCEQDIAVGTLHLEYRGEAGPPWEPGTRYCPTCAVAVWGRFSR